MLSGENSAANQERRQNDMAVNSFFAEQNREKDEKEREEQKNREIEAEKNKLTKAQKDVKEDKRQDCGKTNSLVVKAHEGTHVCTACGFVQ